MLTFIAETREYVWGELRNGDRPTGKQIGDHLLRRAGELTHLCFPKLTQAA
jgi:hypothetical protein